MTKESSKPMNFLEQKDAQKSGTRYESLPEDQKEEIRKRKRNQYASLSKEENDELLRKRRESYAAKRVLQTSGNNTEALEPTNVSCGNDVPSKAFLLNKCTICQHCGAKRFPFESKGFCCSDGDVVLAQNEVHPLMYYLLTSMDEEAVEFRRYNRTYNNRFSFTSIGVRYDKELTKNTKKVYTFKVQGVIYHFINDIFPTNGRSSNLQFFFYDTEHEIQKRMDSPDSFKETTVRKLIDILSGNPYSKFFRSLKDLDNLESKSIVIKATPEIDQRVFNTPTVSQVAGIWIENSDQEGPGKRDIIVHSHGGSNHSINYYFGCYDPLQYPLLFTNGDTGWHEGLTKRNKYHKTQSRTIDIDFSTITSPNELLSREQEVLQRKGSRHNVSCRQYYCYKLQIRPSEKSILLLFGRLLQQYVVDMYIKIETSRLDYIRNEQQRIRSELYQGIVDSINHGESRGSKVGRRIVLPSSFIGGPRDMRRRYLDAMTLVQRYGKPDIFLTLTCNPSWPEIQNELLHHVEEAQNRPDLTTRIFRSRLEELKVDIFKRRLFGRVIAYTYVVEFQKRGLPHAHFLLILHLHDKITTPEAYDKYICAEIPDKMKMLICIEWWSNT